jgi:hypothetical protein
LQFSENLIKKLRQAALDGKQIPDLVALMPENNSPFIPILCLREAFHLGIGEAKGLGNWNRYGSPGCSDDAINSRLMPLILANQEKWNI